MLMASILTYNKTVTVLSATAPELLSQLGDSNIVERHDYPTGLCLIRTRYLGPKGPALGLSYRSNSHTNLVGIGMPIPEHQI